MRPLNDYFIQSTLDPNSTVALRFPVPDGGRISKVLACRNAALTAACTLTFTTARGAVTQTVVLPTGGAAGDVFTQEFVTGAGADANNIIAEGEQVRYVGGGGPAAGVLVQITIVIRR